MEEKIVREIMKECRNWKERLLVRLFAKTFINIYNKIRIKIVNSMINDLKI